jgi:Short C-terminal domain
MAFRRMGRPGLLGTVGRTAVIAGTATMTANAVNRHGQQPGADQDAYAEPQAYATSPAAQPVQAYVPPQPAPPETDLVAQLARLAQLRDAGALTKEEFHTAKAELLSG